MTILDIEGQINRTENTVTYALRRNALRNGLGAAEMKAVIDVYYEISESLIQLFNENWFADNLEETNSRIHEKLQNYMPPNISEFAFSSLEEARDTAEYVLTLPFPADLETIKAFFEEVLTGRLEFVSRYPIGVSDAYRMINSIRLLIDI